MKRNPIAEAATLIRHSDGSRELFWPQDGIRRRYSRQQIAEMFLGCVLANKMNPLLERLLSPREMADLYASLQEVSDNLPAMLARDTTSDGDEQLSG